MKATENNLLTFLDGTKQFIIPIYQRTYSWEISDCQQLWEDIFKIAQDDQVPAHFIGSIVYVGKGIFHVASVPELLVIDGQQRLTALFLLLGALAEALEAQREKISIVAPKKIRNQYLFNANEEDEKYYKLVLTQSDKETLNALLEGRELTEQYSHRIKEAYQFFREQISQCEISLADLFRGIGKLVIVDIALQQQDNPQLIFESLNSTGMALSQADLIRNYVLMGLDHKEQENLYKKYWYPMEQSFGQTQNSVLFNRFMRDYLTLHTGEIPNVDKVYATFKLYQKHLPISIEDLVADIYNYSRYFTRMVLAKEKDPALKQCFDSIKTLEVNVVYPFLLKVYHDYEQHILVLEDFVAILWLIESYVFRRLICGIPTQGLNKVFAVLAKEVDKEYYLESIQAALLQKNTTGRFPRDEEFKAEFVVKDIYNFRNRHYLLSKLENYGRAVSVNIDDYTIEHILPQNKDLLPEWQRELGPNWQEVQAQYLHTIGNLTLTGSGYNTAMRDRPFLEKRQVRFGLTQSGLQINAGLEMLDRWNAEEIDKRAQILVMIATKIWALPNLSTEQINKYVRRAVKAPLVEVVGPVDHPLAGSIPANYKIVPVSEKKFHYYRSVDGEWTPYGNGKVAWYAISWAGVGKNIRDLAKKNEKPLGGVTVKLPPGKIDQPQEPNSGDYTIDHYRYLQGPMLTLFELLRKRLLSLDPLVKQEYKKFYIAYKTTTNFVDVEPYQSFLKLFLNMSFHEIDDPKNLCRNVSTIGHHGNGEVEVRLSSANELDDIMDLVRQAFEIRGEEGAA